MEKIKSVVIVAAGNGGITAAADLKKRGLDVVLYDLPEKSHKLEKIIENKGIYLTYEGKEEFVSGVKCSTDIKSSIEGADVIMFTMPALLVEKYAEVVAPVVREDQLLFFNAAASLSGIRFINKAKDLGLDKKFFIAESNSLTYATRADYKTASVNLSLKVKQTLVAALPKEKTQKAADIISQMYDGIIPVEDVWRILLENANPEVHPGPCLLNVGQIEKNPDTFSLYRDGFTEHSANILKGVSVERRNIAKAFGYELEGIIESRINRGYFSEDRKEIHLMFNESPVFSKINGPSSVKSRYFIEDIEDGLVLWSELGKVCGVETPIIDSIINLSSLVIGIDFFKEGLTLEKLNMDGRTLEELKEMV